MCCWSAVFFLWGRKFCSLQFYSYHIVLFIFACSVLLRLRSKFFLNTPISGMIYINKQMANQMHFQIEKNSFRKMNFVRGVCLIHLYFMILILDQNQVFRSKKSTFVSAFHQIYLFIYVFLCILHQNISTSTLFI